MVNFFLKIPSWAALSLLMNGLLFVTLLAVWQEKPGNGDAFGIPRASAAASESSPRLSRVGDPLQLNYRQRVALLRREMQTMQAKHPDHLTVLLGDSLSLWFPADLLPGRRVWMNQSISGEKTRGLLGRLKLLDGAKVDTVFLMIGINDLIWGESDAKLIKHYRQIMAHLKRHHPDTQVVVQSILPHGSEQATWESRERLLALPNSRIQAVNQSLQKIAQEYDAYYLDLQPLFSTGEGTLRPDLTTDGLHLNWQGYLVWRSAIAMYSQLELQ